MKINWKFGFDLNKTCIYFSIQKKKFCLRPFDLDKWDNLNCFANFNNTNSHIYHFLSISFLKTSIVTLCRFILKNVSFYILISCKNILVIPNISLSGARWSQYCRRSVVLSRGFLIRTLFVDVDCGIINETITNLFFSFYQLFKYAINIYIKIQKSLVFVVHQRLCTSNVHYL